MLSSKKWFLEEINIKYYRSYLKMILDKMLLKYGKLP